MIEELKLAAFNGEDEEVTQILLAGRCNVNAIDKETGWTALIGASFNGFLSTVVLLLSEGADVNLRTEVQNVIRL